MVCSGGVWMEICIAQPTLTGTAAPAAPSGDGSAERPFNTLHEAITVAGRVAWVLVAPGRYEEEIAVPGTELHLIGACASRTTLVGPAGRPATTPSIVVGGRAGQLDLRGFTVRGPRYGALVRGGATLRVLRSRFVGNVGLALGVFGADTRAEVRESEILGTTAQVGGVAGGVAIQAEPEAPGARGPTLLIHRSRLDDNADSALVLLNPSTRAEVVDSAITRTRRAPTGDRGYGVQAVNGAMVSLSRSLIAANAGDEVLLKGGAATLDTCALLGSLDARPPVGTGLWAQGGAQVTTQGSLIAGHEGVGVEAAESETRVELSHSLVSDTLAEPTRASGQGVEAQRGAEVTARQCALTGNVGSSVIADGAMTRVSLDEVALIGVAAPPDRAAHRGAQAQNGATLTLRRGLVADFSSSGVSAHDAGSSLSVEASVVRDLTGAGGVATDFGIGAVVTLGASLRASSTRFERCAGVALAAAGDGASLALDGCVVRETLTRWEGLWGRAVDVNTGSVSFEASRTLLQGNTEVAAMFATPGVTARLDDVLIVDTRPSSRGLGVGLFAYDGAGVDAARLAIVGATGGGLTVTPTEAQRTTRVTVEDLFVQRVGVGTVRFDGPQPSGALVAYGVQTGVGCSLDARRALIDGAGFGFFNDRGALSLRDVVIARQAEGLGAVGLGTADVATSLTDVTSVNNADATVQVRSDLPSATTLAAPTPIDTTLPVSTRRP